MGMCNGRDSLSLDIYRASEIEERDQRENNNSKGEAAAESNRRDHGRLWRKYTCRSPGIVICRQEKKIMRVCQYGQSTASTNFSQGGQYLVLINYYGHMHLCFFKVAEPVCSYKLIINTCVVVVV